MLQASRPVIPCSQKLPSRCRCHQSMPLHAAETACICNPHAYSMEQIDGLKRDANAHAVALLR